MCEFLLVECGGRQQDLIADADLADVVEQAGQVEVVDLRVRAPHLLVEPRRDPGDPLAVPAGLGILRRSPPGASGPPQGTTEAGHPPSRRSP